MQDTRNLGESQASHWTHLIDRKIAIRETLPSTLLASPMCLASREEVQP